jgi:hypothetical protein
MNAPAPAQPSLPAVGVLELRAETRAFLWSVCQMEMDEAVDALQAYAERSGLLDQIGQDAVQAIIAAPFGHYRKLIEPVEPEAVPLQPKPEPEAPRRSHRTPQSTIDAFWYVVQLGDADYLTGWLAQHPLDAPELHEIWKHKCAQATA